MVLIALAVVLLFILDGHKNEQGMLISILQKSAILAIVAVAMNLLNGFTGLFSLGQAGFMSIGAYVTAILMIPVASLDGVYYMNGVAPGIRSMKEAMEAGPAWLQAAYPFLALIAGGGVFWFKRRQAAERERQRILREKRRQRLADIGYTEEDFERLLDERRKQHDMR